VLCPRISHSKQLKNSFQDKNSAPKARFSPRIGNTFHIRLHLPFEHTDAHAKLKHRNTAFLLETKPCVPSIYGSSSILSKAANNPLSVCSTIQYRKNLFLIETHGCFFPQQGPNPWKNPKVATEDTSLSNF